MNNKAKDERGFTLVEMLIVFVLAALVVTFLFSVLGNAFFNATIQQAAAKVAEDMRSIYDAAQKYNLDKAVQATGLSGGVTTLNGAAPQYIIPVPFPPPSVGGSYVWDSASYTDTWGTAAADTVVTVSVASQSVCAKINELYAGGAVGAPPPAAADGTKDIQCFGAGPYTALKTIYIN